MMTAVSAVLLVCATFAVVSATSDAKENCTVKLVADVYILTDGSNSINSVGWMRSLEFVSNLTNSFPIGPTHVQFAFGTFSTRFVHIFDLNKYTSQDDVSKAVNTTTHLKGITYTFEALREIRVNGYLNSTSKGARPGVPKILIVVTDGSSDNITRTIAEADALRREQGVHIIVVSVGGVNQVECIGIAGTEKNVFSVKNFAGLDAIKRQITQRVCEVVVPEPDPCPGTVSMDLVFVIDSSGSIANESYKKNFEFVVKSVRDFTLGPKATRVALLTFSSSTRVIFPLTDDINFIYEKLMNVPHQFHKTRTHLALIKAMELLKVENGGRNEAKKIVVLVTDGLSTEPNKTLEAASTLRGSQILVITIGVQPRANEAELKAVASKPEYSFLVSNYSVLVSFANPVSDVACKESIPPPTVPTPPQAENTPPPTVPIQPSTVPIQPSTEPILPPTVSSDTSTAKENCTVKLVADVYILIDGSNSIKSVGWMSSLAFVSNLTNSFPLGPEHVQFAFGTFSTYFVHIFDLNKYTSQDDVSKAVNYTIQLRGITYTFDALRTIRVDGYLNSTSKGARPGVPKILIVVTDGNSDNITRTIAEADALRREQGVHIIVVSVGGVNQVECIGIAGTEKNVFSVHNISGLDAIKRQITHRVCEDLVPEPDPCPGTVSMDLVFVIDSSGGIGNESYKKNFEFVVKSVRDFTLGPKATRVALLTFGSIPQVIFPLTDDINFIYEKLMNVPYQNTTTNTHLALNKAVELLKVENGGRNEAKKIVVVVTNDLSTEPNKTLAAASTLRGSQVLVITLGVQPHANVAELKAVASKPEYYFLVSNYSILVSFANPVSAVACKELVPEPDPCPETVAVDLVFAIDSSGSIGDGNYKKNFEFVVKSIRDFTLGPKATRAALLTFASSPRVIFKLTDNSSLINEKLMNVRYQNTTTKTHLALKKAQELLTVENGGRNEAKKIVVVVTDGLSTEPNKTLEAASTLRASQILVITVGVNPHGNEAELKAVASKPEYYFLVSNYSVLVSFANPVSAVACKEPIPPPTVKPCPAATIIDMYFVVDSSGSITNESYHYNFEFIQAIIDVYYIAEDGAKVAMLTFGTYVIPIFKLSGDRAFIREHLKKVPYQGSTTNTHGALNYLIDNGWNTPQNGARNGSHVVILITDGQSTVRNENRKCRQENSATVEAEVQALIFENLLDGDAVIYTEGSVVRLVRSSRAFKRAEPRKAASRVKAAGFTIIAVGVGDHVDKNELNSVASKPEYVISAGDYSVLGNFASKTSDIACKDSQNGGR